MDQSAKLRTVRVVVLTDRDDELFHVQGPAFFVQYKGEAQKSQFVKYEF